MELKTSLRDFLQVLFFRKNVILTLFVTVSLAAFTASVLATPVYQAFTTLVIEREPPAPSLSASTRQVTIPPLLTATQEAAEMARTQSEIIKSRVVLRKAIELQRLAPPSEREMELMLSRLQASISVSPVKDTTDLIKISVWGSNPQRVADMANAIAQAYVSWYIERKKSKASATVLFIDKQLVTLGSELSEGETQLETLKEEGGLVSVKQQVRAALNRLSEFEADYQKALGEERETEVRLRELRTQLSSPDAIILATMRPKPSPTLDALKRRLLDLELKLVSLSGTYTEDSAPVANLEREVEAIRKRLEEEMVKVSLQEFSGDNPIYQGIVREIVSLQTTLVVLRERKSYLEKVLDGYRTEVAELGEKQKEHDSIMRKISVKENIFTLLQIRREEAVVAEALKEEGITTVKILDPAIAPEKPIKPNRLLNSLLGCLAGLVLGVGSASLFEYFDHSFKNVDDVEQFLDLPVLGSIPRGPAGKIGKRGGR